MVGFACVVRVRARVCVCVCMSNQKFAHKRFWQKTTSKALRPKKKLERTFGWTKVSDASPWSFSHNHSLVHTATTHCFCCQVLIRCSSLPRFACKARQKKHRMAQVCPFVLFPILLLPSWLSPALSFTLFLCLCHAGLLRVTYGVVTLFDQEGKQIGETGLTRMSESEWNKIQ